MRDLHSAYRAGPEQLFSAREGRETQGAREVRKEGREGSSKGAREEATAAARQSL